MGKLLIESGKLGFESRHVVFGENKMKFCIEIPEGVEKPESIILSLDTDEVTLEYKRGRVIVREDGFFVSGAMFIEFKEILWIQKISRQLKGLLEQ